MAYTYEQNEKLKVAMSILLETPEVSLYANAEILRLMAGNGFDADMPEPRRIPAPGEVWFNQHRSLILITKHPDDKRNIGYVYFTGGGRNVNCIRDFTLACGDYPEREGWTFGYPNLASAIKANPAALA